MATEQSGIPTKDDTVIGRTVVELGLATEQEVKDCFSLQKQLADSEQARSLADLLLTNRVITEGQLVRTKKVIDTTRSDQQIPGFQILKKLGSGAMATVVKARQLSLDRIVAIKVLPQKYTTDPEFLARFYDEGRAAAKLNHPNIVQAYDVGQSGDFHYFVMEYVEGYSVYEHLEKDGCYNEKDSMRIVTQIAEALEHVHSRGLMHRDVKPKNIMITTDGVGKLADLGLARQVEDAEAAQAEAGKAYGTPYYISPEQIRGRMDIDFRADIYGLGATFYHMVTGQVPFDAPNPSSVMHKHLKDPLIPPDHIKPELSAGVGEVIEVMMAKNRDERYASTSDLLEDLRALSKGEPPMLARKKIELSGLAHIEESAESQTVLMDSEKNIPLADQPAFWVMMFSILMNIIMIFVLIIMATK